MRRVFVSGGTGYIGRPFVEQLVRRGHAVTTLARAESVRKIPSGCVPVVGNALDSTSFTARVAGHDSYVHMVGVAHPSPAKARQFREIDQVAFEASLNAALGAGIEHFVYVSVAHPAPVMRAYLEVRQACEERLRESGLRYTALRPWYVLGPGHWWPYAIVPVYRLLEMIPSTREAAGRLGLITRPQMIAALVWAAENPAVSARIIDVPAIRRIGDERLIS